MRKIFYIVVVLLASIWTCNIASAYSEITGCENLDISNDGTACTIRMREEGFRGLIVVTADGNWELETQILPETVPADAVLTEATVEAHDTKSYLGIRMESATQVDTIWFSWNGGFYSYEWYDHFVETTPEPTYPIELLPIKECDGLVLWNGTVNIEEKSGNALLWTSVGEGQGGLHNSKYGVTFEGSDFDDSEVISKKNLSECHVGVFNVYKFGNFDGFVLILDGAYDDATSIQVRSIGSVQATSAVLESGVVVIGAVSENGLLVTMHFNVATRDLTIQ